jgi:beta-phosphoglucomutase
VQAVVFDFDGVLADTEGLHFASFQDVFAPRGWTLTRDAYFADYLGFDDRDLIAAFTARHGLAVSAADAAIVADEKARAYDRRIRTGDVLFPSASATVARLATRYRLGVASGSLRSEIASILSANRLEGHFSVIVGADDVERGKPAPDLYARAVERLGVDPAEAVAVEDSPWGIESARTAGLRTIGITTSYGRARLADADLVIGDLAEIADAAIEALASSGAS